MKLIVHTQYRENYGSPKKPYWKFKGGDNYVAQVESLDTLNELAEEVTKAVEYRNDMATNEVIGWFVMGDNEAYPEEWYDVTIMTKVDGKWERKTEIVAEPQPY